MDNVEQKHFFFEKIDELIFTKNTIQPKLPTDNSS